jgi:hypothetical protein
VRVHHDEGVANHIGPEPCVVTCEGEGEASVGERIGQPLSRESYKTRMPTLSCWWKATRLGALARAPVRSGVVKDPGMCGRSLRGNREISCPTVGHYAPKVRIGKARSRSR